MGEHANWQNFIEGRKTSDEAEHDEYVRRAEREAIARMLIDAALEHAEAAEESRRNDEHEDAGLHQADAETLLAWAARIRARSNPPAPPVAEQSNPADDFSDEVAF